MVRLGMVIDLKRCYGCYSCQVTCKSENLTPLGVFFSRVIVAEAGKYPVVSKQALPILCMQCRDPECKKVCPTNATTQRPDGVVVIDKEKCIGCKYCMMACPYGSRMFLKKWESYFPNDESLKDIFPECTKLSPIEEYAKKRWIEKYGEGTVSKCSFCVERVEKGLKPACVETCPGKARYFGDLDDPESEVSQLIKIKRGFQLNPEFGTDPAVYYLPVR